MQTQTQTQTNRNPNPQFPIQELEQIEKTIQASEQLLTTLQSRREALTKELEAITRPQVSTIKSSLKLIGPGLEYRGEMLHHWSYIDIHINLLRRLWTEYPQQREAMAQAMGKHGKTRAYVARTREELFPGQPLVWALRHSKPLVEGWYVDTNINGARMRRILPAAVRAAGMGWGKDVKAYWHATRVAE